MWKAFKPLYTLFSLQDVGEPGLTPKSQDSPQLFQPSIYLKMQIHKQCASNE